MIQLSGQLRKNIRRPHGGREESQKCNVEIENEKNFRLMLIE